MKSGIVMKVEDGRAVVLETGGAYRTVTAQPGWRAGDVIWMEGRERTAPSLGLRAALALAACVVLFIGGYGVFFHQIAYISLDVNPSVELGINRLGRVISVTARNDEGQALLTQVDVRQKDYAQAMQLLLTSDFLRSYVEQSPEIVLAVMSGNEKREANMLAVLQSTAEQAVLPHCSGAHISCYPVDHETIRQARSHQVTPGKYVLLMQLKELDPQLDMEEYVHHGVGELCQEIQQCHGGDHGEGGCTDHCEHEDGHRHGPGCRRALEGEA